MIVVCISSNFQMYEIAYKLCHNFSCIVQMVDRHMVSMWLSPKSGHLTLSAKGLLWVVSGTYYKMYRFKYREQEPHLYLP